MTKSGAKPLKEHLVVGKLLKSRGLSGEIGIYPYADDLSRFLQLRTCRLENEDGHFVREISVIHANVSGNKVFLRFEGIETREDADKLTGLYLSVPRSEAVPLAENSWYVTDLLKCRVFDRERGELGILIQVIENNANDLLQVRKDGEKDLYIPFLKSILEKVDPVGGEIHLRLPAGLYELYRNEE